MIIESIDCSKVIFIKAFGFTDSEIDFSNLDKTIFLNIGNTSNTAEYGYINIKVYNNLNMTQDYLYKLLSTLMKSNFINLPMVLTLPFYKVNNFYLKRVNPIFYSNPINGSSPFFL